MSDRSVTKYVNYIRKMQEDVKAAAEEEYKRIVERLQTGEISFTETRVSRKIPLTKRPQRL